MARGMVRARSSLALHILFNMFTSYTCLNIPERMAVPRMDRLKKADKYKLEFALKSIKDEGQFGTAVLNVHSERKQKKVFKKWYKNNYEGQTMTYYRGHMEDQLYWKVMATDLRGNDSSGGEFSIKIKLHQNIRSDFIVILEIHAYVYRWWWEGGGLTGKEKVKIEEFFHTGGAYNRTTHEITLDKPLRPIDVKEAIVTNVTYVKPFNWASDDINVKVDVKLEWINQLNYNFPDTFEKITHNSVLLEKRIFDSQVWLKWQELEKAVPTNYKYEKKKRNVPNSIVTSVPLNKPAELRFRLQANNLIGTSTPSPVVVIERPPPPYDLRVVIIAINAKNDKQRDFSLQWLNSPVRSNGGINEIQIYKNLVEFRIKNDDELWGVWTKTTPRQVEVKKEDYLMNLLSLVNTFTGMKAKETQFRVMAFNIFGASEPSNMVILVRPHPPTKLKCTRISVTKGFPNLRSFELEWENPGPDGANRVIRNWFEHKAYTTDSSWAPVKPPSTDVGLDDHVHQYRLRRRINVTGLPPEECLFRVKAENYVGFSGFSNIVTLKRPLPATNLSVLDISLAKNNSKENPAIDIKFQFGNPNYDKVNKAYKVKFQYRNAKKNYSINKYDMDYSPWIDTEPIILEKRDSRVTEVTLKDYKTDDKHPAVQFRIIIVGYVSESLRGSIITIVRPSPLTLKLNAIYHHEAPETNTSSTRYFEFNITNQNKTQKKKLASDITIPDHLNKIIKIIFDYRISRDIDGKEEPWVVSEKIELDPKEYGAFNLTKYLIITFAKYNYVEAQYRVYGIGYIGTSLPSNIVTVKVPTSPREVNCIYYGSDVDCNKTCELEIDWRMPESNGTFEILDYIIQYKQRTLKNKLGNWKNNYTVPETGLPYKRQFITFNYNNEYRIVARSIFGNSLPSHILWTIPFASYHLKLDYRKNPEDNDTIIIDLEWEKIKDKKIADYIVQSNLFFEHDTRVMGTEKIVNFRVFNVQFSKKIEFLKYFVVDNKTISRLFYLPEFRVITRYVNESLFGPASCTTILHFSKNEFRKKGASLKGSMP